MWIERAIDQPIKKLTSSFPIVILTGARQVGKTSILRHIYPDYSFITLDLPSLATLAEEQPEEMLRQHPTPVIIDEVQYAPQLFRFLKLVVDRNRSTYGQFLLTGSQQFPLMKQVADSLAGRCAVLDLETLSFAEMRAAHPALSAVDAMVRGGFPELQARQDLDRNAYYNAYVATYLERDVRSLLQVGHLRDFERFIRACAFRSAQLLNKSELARDVGISPDTANEWLSVLQASHQVVLLEPWFSNKTKSLIKSPKLYITDVGLMCFLVGIDNPAQLVGSPFAGPVWETFVFSELRKQQLLMEGRHDLWFLRTKHGLEVDFLLHRGGRFTLIEAKFAEQPGIADTARIQKAADFLGESLVDQRILICRSRTAFPLGAGVTCLPLQDMHRIFSR